MDAEQLRENAHKMVDFIADYYKSIENFPVLSQVQPGYLHNLIPDSAPHHPESLQNVLDGEVIQSVSYNLKLLGKKEKKETRKKIILLAQLCMQLIIQSLCGIKNYFITQAKLNCIVNFL